MNVFDLLDNAAGTKKIIKAPFGRSGGKSRILDFVLDNLPHRKAFVEVFGGTGIVMLNRLPSQNDVFNDINSGVVSVYRCLRDASKMQRLMDLIDCTIQSYEDWVTCKITWEDTSDDVERALRWLYLVTYSFASQGRAYGYSKGTRGLAGKLHNKIECFGPIHARFKSVNVENLNWSSMLERYDSHETVFYLDPPYPDSDMAACYGKHVMSWDEHRSMLAQIKNLKGFVALSGYANNLYDSQDFWTKRLTTLSYASSSASMDRSHAEEVLWIKD